MFYKPIPPPAFYSHIHMISSWKYIHSSTTAVVQNKHSSTAAQTPPTCLPAGEGRNRRLSAMRWRHYFFIFFIFNNRTEYCCIPHVYIHIYSSSKYPTISFHAHHHDHQPATQPGILLFVAFVSFKVKTTHSYHII